MKTYHELITLPSFKERLEYLRTNSKVSYETFGVERYVNQELYRSRQWKLTRQKVIVRDMGCDLGVDGYIIYERPIIHHIVPITIDDIEDGSDKLFDLDNLILTCFHTHNIIHYGTVNKLSIPNGERKPGDTCLWK